MTSTKRILLDATAAREPLTGVGWSMVETVAALAHSEHDLEIHVATVHPDMFAEAGAGGGLVFHHLGGAGFWQGTRFALEQVAVPRLAAKLDVALLHALTMPGPLHAPCPVVVTVHDIAFRHFPETVPRFRRLWYRAALPVALKRAALVATNSETTALEVRTAYGLDSEHVVTTPFGTPTWTLDAPEPGPTPADGPFLFVGALEPRKNLATLLEAFELFHDQAVARDPLGPRPRLRIVGAPGWRNRRILSRIARMERKGAVLSEGYCDRDGLLCHLESACALLLPSLHEGFGFPILEGMARHRPVITSNRGAMREVAGDAALMVDPEDPAAIAAALDRLWCDPDLGEELARRGRKRITQWTWSRTARSLLGLYSRIPGPSSIF